MFAVLLAAVGQISYRVLAEWLDADATLRLTELTDGLRGYIRVHPTPTVAFNARDPDVAAFIHDATQYYQLYDGESGALLAQSDGARTLGLAFSPDQVRGWLNAPPGSLEKVTPSGRVRISNSILVRSRRAYLMQVGVSLAATDRALRRYRDLLLWSLPPALMVAALAAWLLARVALAPLAQVAIAAREIDVRSLTARLPVRGANDELDEVVSAFNETLDRLKIAMDDMRQFSAAVAHELRTPLAILRGEIELGLRRSRGHPTERRMFASQLEEIDKLKRLIDQILTLARAESGQIALTVAPVDLADLASSLVEQLQPVADSKGIGLRCERRGRVVVDGDAGWLERLLLNLLDNALKFTLKSGRVLVSVSATETAAQIVVRDTGVGRSAEDAARAFERFFRADPARSSATDGAGLGLSLAQWIVESHRGTIHVDSRLGEGTTFTVTLPTASARGFARRRLPSIKGQPAPSRV